MSRAPLCCWNNRVFGGTFIAAFGVSHIYMPVQKKPPQLKEQSKSMTLLYSGNKKLAEGATFTLFAHRVELLQVTHDFNK